METRTCAQNPQIAPKEECLLRKYQGMLDKPCEKITSYANCKKPSPNVFPIQDSSKTRHYHGTDTP